MHQTLLYLRNISAFIGSFLLGNLANIGIILAGSKLIPPPPGIDVSDIENLKLNMHVFESKHFIMPFVAHAMGTWVAAYLVARLSVNLHFRFALAMGMLFLLGGIVNVVFLPTPLWFTIVDLVLAYLPMAYLGWKVSTL